MKKYISTLKAHSIKKDLVLRMQIYKQLVEIGLSPQETFTTYRVAGKTLRAGVTEEPSSEGIHCFLQYDNLGKVSLDLTGDIKREVSNYINKEEA